MLPRMDKFKEDYEKIRAKEASQTVDGRNWGDAAETVQKWVKRTHNLPVIFPNLRKAVEDAKKSGESAEEEGEGAGMKPTVKICSSAFFLNNKLIFASENCDPRVRSSNAARRFWMLQARIDWFSLGSA